MRYRPIDPPAAITTAMSAYLAALGLNYGAFDFVITPDGRWVMLECNPDGMWLWLNDQTATPIVVGLADLLTEGTCS